MRARQSTRARRAVRSHTRSLDDDEERRHKRASCRAGDDGDNAVDYVPSGLYPARPSTDTLLAEFFDIDLTAVERERRALLANLPR